MSHNHVFSRHLFRRIARVRENNIRRAQEEMRRVRAARDLSSPEDTSAAASLRRYGVPEAVPVKVVKADSDEPGRWLVVPEARR